MQQLKRHIKLNRQALLILDDEYQNKKAKHKKNIESAQEQLVLLRMQRRFESDAVNQFDPVLSRKLDCIDYLLNN